MDKFYNTCNFNIITQYRLMMGFDSPEESQRVYERAINRLCKKEKK